jgi:uncharacterized membrane-anchored protein YjiN (DUF445 family)
MAARIELSSSSDEADRRRGLRRMKAVALSLLVAAAVVFAVARRYEGGHEWVGYVRATAEAAMVGALADWFAVTALFRRPLRLPIPHTAIIPTRKDALGRSLGSFVQDNFLAAPVIAEKLRHAQPAARAAAWISTEGNPEVVARHVSAALSGAADVLRDDDVRTIVEQAVVGRLRAVPLAPLAGRALELATGEGRHQELIDAITAGAVRFVEQNRESLRARFGRESPWWVPDPVDNRIFDKLYRGLQGFLEEVAATPDHELRQYLDGRLAELAERLRSDPELAARGEKLKEEILAHPAVRAWSGSLWSELKDSVQRQAADDGSELRRRLAEGAAQFGRALAAEPSLRERIDDAVERAVLYVVEQERHQVADLIATTVARWDPNEASRRIEVQVGRDLQFIRINGTLVGGLAGLVIFALGHLL